MKRKALSFIAMVGLLLLVLVAGGAGAKPSEEVPSPPLPEYLELLSLGVGDQVIFNKKGSKVAKVIESRTGSGASVVGLYFVKEKGDLVPFVEWRNGMSRVGVSRWDGIKLVPLYVRQPEGWQTRWPADYDVDIRGEANKVFLLPDKGFKLDVIGTGIRCRLGGLASKYRDAGACFAGPMYWGPYSYFMEFWSGWGLKQVSFTRFDPSCEREDLLESSRNCYLQYRPGA